MRHHAKFHGDRSNGYRHNRDFSTFKMAVVRHLAFVICMFGALDHPRRVFGGIYHCAKFGWNRCSSCDNMHVLMC